MVHILGMGLCRAGWLTSLSVWLSASVFSRCSGSADERWTSSVSFISGAGSKLGVAFYGVMVGGSSTHASYGWGTADDFDSVAFGISILTRLRFGADLAT